MFANLHAVVILGAVIAPLIVVGLSPAWRPRPAREVILAIAPIAAVGLIFLGLLSLAGIPIAEWLFPLIGATIGALFVKSNRAFQVIRWTMFGLSVGLCLNAMALRMDGYASSSLLRAYQAADRNRLAAIADKLRHRFPGDKELPAGSLVTVLAEQELTVWSRSTLLPVWHTAFTGLYQVAETPGEVWYPGGPVESGAGKLEWKAKSMPPDA